MNTKDPFLAALMGADTRPLGGLIATTGRPQATPKTPPHFYRCPECLTTFTTEERFEIFGWGKHKTCKVACDCGAERAEYLGQSAQGRLRQRDTLCPCDARCTEARGPNCDCQCLGANHGTGLLVTVIRDAGPIPKIKTRSPDLCKMVRAEWTAALDAAESRMRAKYGETLERKRRGEWIDRGPWENITGDQQLVLDARKLRTQKARLAKLALVAAR